MTDVTERLTHFPILKDPACPFDPAPALRALDDPVRVELWDGSTPWLITGYDLGRKLLVDPRVSADSTRPGYPHFDLGSRERRKDGRSFVAIDDPEHARQRRMVSSPFAIRNIEALRGDVTDIVNGLIDDLLAGPNPADLVSRFAFPTSTQVICRMLGVPYADHEFFQEQSTLMLHRDSSPERVVGAQEALRGYLRELIDRQRKEPADGLISSVIETQVRTGALSPEQLSYISMTLLVAGLETTGNMIALGTVALLRNPEQLALLRETEDQGLINSAVDELLRYLNISHSGRPARGPRGHHHRRRHHSRRGRAHPRQRTGQPGSGELPRPGPPGHHPRGPAPPGLRLRPPSLSGPPAGQPRTPGRVRHALPAHPHPASRRRLRRRPVQVRRCGLRSP